MDKILWNMGPAHTSAALVLNLRSEPPDEEDDKDDEDTDEEDDGFEDDAEDDDFEDNGAADDGYSECPPAALAEHAKV